MDVPLLYKRFLKNFKNLQVCLRGFSESSCYYRFKGRFRESHSDWGGLGAFHVSQAGSGEFSSV